VIDAYDPSGRKERGLAKRKEPTETYYTVTLEKTVTMLAEVVCKATARLDSTKRGLIKNSGDYLGDRDLVWVEHDESFPKVVEISTGAPNVEHCPHCNGVLHGPERAVDLGEVDD
jgi:hypothetical protein